jgi:hypothetical protein
MIKDSQQSAEEPRTLISDSDRRRIRAAMNRMPYAASTRVPKPTLVRGEPVDADAAVAFLDGLAAVLAEVAEQSDADRGRLFSLEADVDAFRRVIGTAPAEVTR